MPIKVSVDQQAMKNVASAMAAEADGKKLKRQLSKDLREVVKPAIGEVKTGLMAVRSIGSHSGLGLRETVSKKIKVETRYSGRRTGVNVIVGKTAELRGFARSARALNRSGGWRRRVFGRNVWVVQIGNPGFFDDPLMHRKNEYRKAILEAMKDMATRIKKDIKT